MRALRWARTTRRRQKRNFPVWRPVLLREIHIRWQRIVGVCFLSPHGRNLKNWILNAFGRKWRFRIFFLIRGISLRRGKRKFAKRGYITWEWEGQRYDAIR